MKLRNLYLLNTIVSLSFALGFLLMSPFPLGLSGMDVISDAWTLGQLMAVELADMMGRFDYAVTAVYPSSRLFLQLISTYRFDSY